jgi:CheY-like chemotaxis protein
MIPKTAPIKRILVVEDVQETRDAIEALLKNSGYDVEPARDEKEAVERAAWNSPDLVLISLGGSPDQVLNTAYIIRARAGLGCHIPIVIFSIQTMPEGAEQEIGENIHLARPDNFDQLRVLLARVLRRSSPVQ